MPAWTSAGRIERGLTVNRIGRAAAGIAAPALNLNRLLLSPFTKALVFVAAMLVGMLGFEVVDKLRNGRHLQSA